MIFSHTHKQTNRYPTGWECCRDCGLLPPVGDLYDKQDMSRSRFEDEDGDAHTKKGLSKPLSDVDTQAGVIVQIFMVSQ